MPEEFDFSKLENQQRFEQLPREEQKAIIEESRTEALEENEKRSRDKVNEIILTPKQERAKEELISRLHIGGEITEALKIKTEFSLPEEVIQEEIKKAITNSLTYIWEKSPESRIKHALILKKEFSFPENVFQQVVEEAMIFWMGSRGNSEEALRIKNELSSPDKNLTEVVQCGLARLIAGRWADATKNALILKKEFSLPEDVFQQAVKKGLIDFLVGQRKDRFTNKYVDEIIKELTLPEDIIQPSELEQAAKEKVIEVLKDGEQSDVVAELIRRYPQFVTFSRPLVKNVIIRFLSDGWGGQAVDFKKYYPVLLEEDIQSPKIQQAAKSCLISSLSQKGQTGFAIEIQNGFSLPEDFVQSLEVRQAAKEGIMACLSAGEVSPAVRIKKNFPLPEEIIQSPEIQQAAKAGMIDLLSGDYIDKALEIKEEFFLPGEILQSYDVQRALKEAMIKNLSKGAIDRAVKLKEEFSLKIDNQEIIAKFDDIKSVLTEIQRITPEFYNQALKSFEIFITLFRLKEKPDLLIKTLQEVPFLTRAIVENPRFGSRLLLKYPELDVLSKQNIKFLFDGKEQILTATPEIDPESWEFRQLIQEKLKVYENNPEILRAIVKSGVDTNEWLKYAETRYFNLATSESELAFSETAHAPIKRIKETLDSYSHTIREVFKEYKPELTNFRIPLEDTKETGDKIAAMEIELSRARTENNERKVQGIAKGIESLKKRLESIKTMALWDKLSGDIAAFQGLKNDVFNAQEELIQAEKDLVEKLSGKLPSGKMIKELKDKINKAKEELRNKFWLLERRIDDFQTNLPILVSPCLGQDRTEGLIQEIHQNLAEQFEHYRIDRGTLVNLFSESSAKEKKRLKNQPMSIFVWARNADIDLYQGDYSPCCICIENQHMGAESTIADYNTDLGVQIVNVWDESKNKPVTAAWCWLGENEKGETALVVDNIESNTLYSANYPEQLTRELFDYIKNYAQAIGVKKVVLGEANNDLPTANKLAKIPNDGRRYEKIGGYNRADGYFLEAEKTSVKLIWERKNKIKEKQEKEAKKVKKVDFRNVGLKNLNQKDFAKLKELERKIYAGTDLILGQAMIEDIQKNNGLEYSMLIAGKRPRKTNEETIGYLVAVEDETDDGDACVYLEDIAVLPEAQHQGIAWSMLKNLIEKLKTKAQKENKSVLLDMHLREDSQKLFERHHADLEQMSVELIEEAIVPDYYDEGEDALYKVFQIQAD